MTSSQLTSALNLTRRLPPEDIEKVTVGLLRVVPGLGDELLQRVDRPLQISRDEEAKKDFIACDFNSFANSHRSPWTNAYYPPPQQSAQIEANSDQQLKDGGSTKPYFPGEELRNSEVLFNEVFERYVETYFGDGTSSCYVWLTGEDNLAVAVLFHKKMRMFVERHSDDGDGDDKRRDANEEAAATSLSSPGDGGADDKEGVRGLWQEAVWDSCHVCEVIQQATQNQYNLTSSLRFYIVERSGKEGTDDCDDEPDIMTFSEQMTKQSETSKKARCNVYGCSSCWTPSSSSSANWSDDRSKRDSSEE